METVVVSKTFDIKPSGFADNLLWGLGVNRCQESRQSTEGDEPMEFSTGKSLKESSKLLVPEFQIDLITLTHMAESLLSSSECPNAAAWRCTRTWESLTSLQFLISLLPANNKNEKLRKSFSLQDKKKKGEFKILLFPLCLSQLWINSLLVHLCTGQHKGKSTEEQWLLSSQHCTWGRDFPGHFNPVHHYNLLVQFCQISRSTS